MTDINEVKLRVRAHDPVTSVLAAGRSMQFSNSQKGRILAALAVLGSATAREIGAHTGLSIEQAARRLVEIERDKLAEVLRFGDNDLIRDGCRVWRLTWLCSFWVAQTQLPDS